MMMLRLRRRKVPSSRQDEREKEMKVVLAELFFFLPFLPRFSLSFVVRIRYPAVVGAKKQGQGIGQKSGP